VGARYGRHTAALGMDNGEAQARTVLVSGGSGFLGGWCVVELLRRGYRVRTTVRDLKREAGCGRLSLRR
jgi:nucleoside-diphosphate-sugar epimerase